MSNPGLRQRHPLGEGPVELGLKYSVNEILVSRDCVVFE